MLDIYKIKQYIIDSPELIELLLEKAGFYKIRKKNKNYKCGNSPETKGNSVNVCSETLRASDFKADVHGDIISIIQNQTGKSFFHTIKFICGIIGLDEDNLEKEKNNVPFNGFFENIGENKKNRKEILQIYDDEILEKYEKMPSLLFYRDGIAPEIQNKYEISYDTVSRRIVIPYRDTLGNLVGIIGRYNQQKIEEDILKYHLIIPFSKSKILYGYDKNYNSIQEKRIVFLSESQKSVMQTDSMGINLCLATGSASVSDTQINYIYSLNPKVIIIGFDEGLEQGYIHKQAEKIKINNLFFNTKIGYIYDKNNEILLKNSKDSPYDVGKKKLKKLLKNNIVWL